MSTRAQGTFEVKITPLAAEESTGGEAVGRFALDKRFQGHLEGTSKGLMLGGGNQAAGIAGYVAMENFVGTLHGRSGSFSLQHLGTMGGGKFDLQVIVVPGSGAGDLAGIDGAMTITVAGGRHSYEFDYTLPAP